MAGFTPTPFDPNPYANFDPSQWANPYSNFQSQAIPFPASYSGWPTNALGQPIQQPPGMTLNSSAASPAAAAAPAASSNNMYNAPSPSYNMGTVNSSAFSIPSMGGGIDPSTGMTQAQANARLQNYYNPTQGSMVGGGDSGGGTGGGYSHTANATPMGPSPQSMGVPPPWAQQQAAAAPAAAPAANPAGLSSQQYLQLMSHPGQVTTPGATVPESPNAWQPTSGGAGGGGAGGPGVLQTFLQNWRPAQSGAGSGFQQAFSKALKGS